MKRLYCWLYGHMGHYDAHGGVGCMRCGAWTCPRCLLGEHSWVELDSLNGDHIDLMVRLSNLPVDPKVCGTQQG